MNLLTFVPKYKIYLFEAILLCCKEIDPNKQRNRVVSRAGPARTGKPKLQLKGRIFMQNVTEAISISKPGQYRPFCTEDLFF